ncbi:MAG: hypothetical protein K9H64_10845 [Bacteroidales bacterium]|nr:hypothetical protein [Bacteroidales bacterium]MCF8456405.1 hypothetical protein [Bacteroidales bacterium]
MRNTKSIFFIRMAFFGLLAIAAFSFVTLLLWNWLIPVLFSGPVITFWQALGLLVLSKILFSGFHKHGPGESHHSTMRDHFMSKFHKLSPEEKEKMKSRFEEKWCRPKKDEGGDD